MRVRLLTETDGSSYRALRLASIEESPALSSPEIVCELAFFARFGKGVLGNHSLEGTLVWGAYTGERLVGVVAVARGFERGNSHTVHLWGLYVCPAFRGSGVGTLLLRAAIAWTRRQPATTKTVLYAHHGDCHALQLFRQFGFEFVADDALRGTRLCAMRLDCRATEPAAARTLGGSGPEMAADGQPGVAGSMDRVAGRNAQSG